MTIPVEELTLFFVSLFTIFSPFASIGGIATISSEFSRAAHRRMAAQVAVNYAVVLIAATWVGSPLLILLGLTVPSLTLTGGIALLLTAAPMMLHGERTEETEQETVEAIATAETTEDWRSVVVVPLSFPLSVGGATAAIAIAVSARFPSVTDRVFISAVVLVMALVVGATHYLAPLIGTRLRESGGMDVLARVSGIVLSAIAVQLLARGTVGLLADAGVTLGG